VIGAGVQQLDKLAQQAMVAGNTANAEQLVAQALRLDPNDTQACPSRARWRSVSERPAAGGAAAAPAPRLRYRQLARLRRRPILRPAAATI